METLLAVLDPELVVQADAAAAVAGIRREVRGGRNWAGEAITATRCARFAHAAMVDGTVGLVVPPKGRLFRVLRFTFSGGKIAVIELVGDSDRLRAMKITVLDETWSMLIRRCAGRGTNPQFGPYFHERIGLLSSNEANRRIEPQLLLQVDQSDVRERFSTRRVSRLKVLPGGIFESLLWRA